MVELAHVNDCNGKCKIMFGSVSQSVFGAGSLKPVDLR